MSGKPTPGSATGTKIVYLEGGPPEWDGEVTGVSKTSVGTLERWDHTADAAVVYGATERTHDVDITHERRNGPVVETKPAQVYEYLGYKEDLG